MNADGISPEVDRLDASGTKYVIRGNTVTFKVRAENFTRARVQVSGSFRVISLFLILFYAKYINYLHKIQLSIILCKSE